MEMQSTSASSAVCRLPDVRFMWQRVSVVQMFGILARRHTWMKGQALSDVWRGWLIFNDRYEE
jgi:hypothetical protein